VKRVEATGDVEDADAPAADVDDPALARGDLGGRADEVVRHAP
jgi:hypothetical protein